MGKTLDINLNNISSGTIREISSSVEKGNVILYPTDTIYGLGCDVFNENAVRKIFEIKGRAETKPLLALAHSLSMIETLVEEISPLAKKLLKIFSGKPLTIIFPASKNIPAIVTANTNTIGIRIPNTDFCQELLRESNIPLVSTSANISGKEIPTSIAEIEKIFSSKVDLFINAGNLPPSLPSTIIDITSGTVEMIREGAIKKEEFSEFLD